MSPEQFLARLSKSGPDPAYLFLGPEAYDRGRCRKALIEAALPAEERESGVTRHELDQIPLAAAIDDARALSLFAPQRVLWLTSAEAALPRGKSVEPDESESERDDGDVLADYLKNPTPGVTLVIDASRYD